MHVIIFGNPAEFIVVKSDTILTLNDRYRCRHSTTISNRGLNFSSQMQIVRSWESVCDQRGFQSNDGLPRGQP